MTWVGVLAAVALAGAVLLRPSRETGTVDRGVGLIPSIPPPVAGGRHGSSAGVSPGPSGGRVPVRGRMRRWGSAAPPGRIRAWVTGRPSAWVTGRPSARVTGPRRPGANGATSREVAALLDAIAAALDAGLPVGAALQCAGEVAEVRGPGSVAGVIVEAGRRGDVQPAVWDDLAAMLGDPGAAEVVRGVAQVWRICELTGSPTADALRLAAVAARGHSERVGRLAVATAGPRATIRLLTVLPMLGPAGVLLVWSGAPVPVGVSALAAGSMGAGLVLLVVGHRWSARIVARACLPPLAAPVVGVPSSGWLGRGS